MTKKPNNIKEEKMTKQNKPVRAFSQYEAEKIFEERGRYPPAYYLDEPVIQEYWADWESPYDKPRKLHD